MKKTDTKREALIGFWAGFAVFMLFVADIWSGTAENLPIFVAAGALAAVGALPAAMLPAESIRKALAPAPQPIPARIHPSYGERSSRMRRFR